MIADAFRLGAFAGFVVGVIFTIVSVLIWAFVEMINAKNKHDAEYDDQRKDHNGRQ